MVTDVFQSPGDVVGEAVDHLQPLFHNLHYAYTDMMVFFRVIAVSWRTDDVQQKVNATRRAGSALLQSPVWDHVIDEVDNAAPKIAHALPVLAVVCFRSRHLRCGSSLTRHVGSAQQQPRVAACMPVSARRRQWCAQAADSLPARTSLWRLPPCAPLFCTPRLSPLCLSHTAADARPAISRR
jgi:hypothetical protein